MTATHIIENFNLKEHLTDCEIIVETYPEWGDDEDTVFKKKQLSDELTLYLFDSGQANIEYLGDGSSDNTFMWDEEAARLFDNINHVSAIELFRVIYSKRWDRS